MKRFSIPVLVLALGSTLMAAPQGGGKKAPTAPTTTDTKGPGAKGGAKDGAKGKAKGGKNKSATHTNK